MTCFWDGIINQLRPEDYARIGFNPPANAHELVILLKHFNRKTPCVRWNDTTLTAKQMEENLEHINSFNSNSIHNGYDCSICDPFLLLVTDLFEVEVRHRYLGVHMMKYQPCINVKTRRVIRFTSDSGHFMAE